MKTKWQVLVDAQRMAKDGLTIPATKYVRDSMHCGLREAHNTIVELRNAPDLRPEPKGEK